MSKNHKKRIAFTLIETLIILIIIGVVSVLCIPNLLLKYQNHANYTALKKYHSVLSNAYSMAAKENGASDSWNLYYSLANNSYTSQRIKNTDEIVNYFLAHLEYIKMCKNETGCWAPVVTKALGGTKNYAYAYQGKGFGVYSNTLKLADGANLSFSIIACSDASSRFGINCSKNPLIIVADVNGDKGPNEFGRDSFVFVINEKGLIPAGIKNTQNCNTKSNSSYAGGSCTYKVLQENGINY